MKNLKRIMTERYDTCRHIEIPPYGVQDFQLIDGELFVADEYDWILLNQYGCPIITNWGDTIEEDLGSESEDILDMIKYLIEDAPEKGHIEDADADSICEICELLGEKPQGLKMCRLYAGMTQGELAAKSGVAQQAISEYENGRKSIKQARACTIKDIADSLGVSMEDIIA